MADNRITIRIEPTDPHAEHVRLSDFLRRLDAFRNALQQTVAIVSGGATPLDWEIVKVSHSSPLTVVLEPKLPTEEAVDNTTGENIGAEAVHRFAEYATALATEHTAPPEMGRAALTAFKDLGAALSPNGVRTTILIGDDPLEIPPDFDATVEEILKPVSTAHGSVEGRLEFLNIHGRENVFRIYPIIGPRYVDCTFPDSLLPTAKDAIGASVRVYGLLRFRYRASFPDRIKVSELEVYPPDNELPSLYDIRGMAPDATGDLSSEDFIRKVRSGW